MRPALQRILRQVWRAARLASPMRVIAAGFASIILIGALLLALPAASADGAGANFVDAFFTATSATCVTGLVIADTYEKWSLFGQGVILALIQIGGLGFITVAMIIFVILRRPISYRERLVAREALGQFDVSGIVRRTKRIILAALAIEGCGALLLSLVFIPEYGFWRGVYRGIFHAVSAFCNAGFDILGDKGAFGNLSRYAANPIVNFTVMALIIIGGLGFFVWSDVLSHRRPKTYSLHTKLSIITTAALIILGFGGIFAAEFSNPATLGALPLSGKVWAALFQSVTSRTAGFNTVKIAALSDAAKLFTIMLMFVGGSPGSTAGGIKTVTFSVLIISVFAVLRGRSKVNAFGRRIRSAVIMRALAIMMISLAIITLGVTILCIFEGAAFIDILLEVVSAFATVGLSSSLTPALSAVSKIALSFIMYAGRIGVLTLGLAFAARAGGPSDSVKYPTERILIG